MIPFNLNTMAHILNAELVGENHIILNVITDSRSIDQRERCLFIALQGKRFDAHDFAKEAIENTATALLVNRRLSLDVPQLIVSDTYQALGKIGAWIRQQVPARIIALTGSSGKTSVKEMTATILKECGCVLATEQNDNNYIGVSQTLLRLTQEHDFAVIELGANNLGEIARATDLVHPETALVNNLSEAHIAGFGSLSNIAKAKGEIFTGLQINGRGIFNADSHAWARWKKILIHKKVWSFSINTQKNTNFFASDIISDQKGIHFILHSPKGTCPISLPLLGKHNAANALAAAALAMSVGAGLKAVSSGLAKVKSISGRLFPIQLGPGQLLLDDTYNANVGSMTAGVQVLADMPGYRVMVVGDMTELGEQSDASHRQVGTAITLTTIDEVLSIGNRSYLIGEASGRNKHFQDKAALTAYLALLLSQQAVITILVKGSRCAKMEQIVHTLQEKAVC
ncbi:UDP-N-acetylmuramoyl-tripeptide--D-alanyl-D-alanine ligase [Candidatus Steffania adelgidicola]|uniref:UDP-N-acetylmuramoyl-tripeptide--D-alanyl-D- alanine ligase n=1 Tax=Candidatus Steffania adelgidicola TaxID=1076626 RepID=UPI001D01A3DF|nr:UDP-N-acetylmuramoyl-tripeptide--D-alanyl-D-alanine ligase [Candidatus Steffania adelgidicola]UDG80134.1 UDP-N-acetylmuramoyl-tripeptide--D-alanyl-D-alanine ligase [Candidatus Steffania adelgidicola]